MPFDEKAYRRTWLKVSRALKKAGVVGGVDTPPIPRAPAVWLSVLVDGHRMLYIITLGDLGLAEVVDVLRRVRGYESHFTSI